MKKIGIILFVIILAECKEKPTSESISNISDKQVRKEDLANARWLLGNWESTWADKSIYQRFTMTSDSSMQVVEVMEMGDDIHHVSINVTWQDSNYYFGRFKNKGYKVMRLQSNEIFMVPEREINSIHWLALTDSTFKAEYQYPQDTQRIMMKRSKIDPDTIFARSRHDEKHRLKY